MAVDRSLNLRPGVLDIADIVDGILQQITPVTYGADGVTWGSGFEQYSTSTTHLVRVERIGRAVYLSGAIKNLVERQANAESVILTLPSGLRPNATKLFVEQGGGINKYMMFVKPNGDVTASRYGTIDYIKMPVNAYLRIDCAFALD